MTPRATAWHDGWYAPARARCHRRTSARGRRAARSTLALIHSISLPPGCYGGDAIERLFTQPRSTGTPIRTSGRFAALEVSAHFLIRRDGALVAVRLLRRAGLACRARRAGRGAPTATTSRSASSSKGLEGEPFEAAQYDALAGLLRGRRAALSDRCRRRPRAHRAGPQEDPGRGFDWARLHRGVGLARGRVRGRRTLGQRNVTGLENRPCFVRDVGPPKTLYDSG